jgi:ribosomal protein S18 acetylase RimI-like enzyme
MNFLELKSLNREQSTHLLELQQAIHKQYQASPLIYWHILKKDRPYACNILAYAGKELIGFASRYLFHQGTTELSLMVHPKFENEFFIKQLCFALIKYIPYGYKNFIVVSTPHQIKPLFKPNADWEFTHCSYRLQWQGPAKKPNPIPNIGLQKAKITDFDGFKYLSDVGFPNGTDMTPEIFESIIEGSQAQLWLLKQDQQVIGSIQINQENKYYRISDITVLPDFRGQGHANYMLKSILHLLQQRQKTIVLDVEDTNPIALNWYLRLGMKKINTSDFWRLPFKEFN